MLVYTKCGACGKFLSPATDGASCSSCPMVFHKSCVSMSDTTTVSKDWSCPDCMRRIRKGDNTNTPVRGLSGSATRDSPPRAARNLNSQPNQPKPKQPATTAIAAQTTAASVTIEKSASDDIRELRREFASSMAELLSELRDIRREVVDFRSTLESVTERMNCLEIRVEALEQRPQASEAGEISNLERTISELKLELNDREQDALLSDIEIGHLPENRGESTVHAVSVLAAKLGVPLEARDVVFAERVGAPASENCESRPRRVVVRLARRTTRDELLAAARVRRTLIASDAGGSTTDHRRIFVNERLTRTNRQLFHIAREECRKLQWRFSWTKRGRIYVRQGDGKTAFQIRNELDIERVFGKSGVRTCN